MLPAARESNIAQAILQLSISLDPFATIPYVSYTRDPTKPEPTIPENFATQYIGGGNSDIIRDIMSNIDLREKTVRSMQPYRKPKKLITIYDNKTFMSLSPIISIIQTNPQILWGYDI